MTSTDEQELKLTGRGGAGRGQGRKKGQSDSTTRKTRTLALRLSDAEHAALEAAAAQSGCRSVSDYVRQRLFDGADVNALSPGEEGETLTAGRDPGQGAGIPS